MSVDWEKAEVEEMEFWKGVNTEMMVEFCQEDLALAEELKGECMSSGNWVWGCICMHACFLLG